jgi:2-beta-glucuronyltransferase
MKIVIITTHEFHIGRKTGLHFLSEFFSKKYKTFFITVGLSYLSFLKKHRQHFSKPFGQWRRVNSNLQTYTWCSLFHPFKTPSKFLDLIIEPFISLYSFLIPKKIKNIFQMKTEKYFVIIENGSGLLLTSQLKSLSTNIVLIYWQSDRLSLLNYPRIIHKVESKYLSLFHFIRTNSRAIAEEYKHKHQNVFYIQQGIQKKLFNQSYPNPYKHDHNVISIGESHLDIKTLIILIELFPDWNFHIFGKNIYLPNYPNLTYYDEIDFKKVVPYIKYANLGLAIYHNDESVAYLADSSLKIIQYSYCKLPIVCPKNINNHQKNLFSYDPLDTHSIYSAFVKAKKFNKNGFDVKHILDWAEIGERVLKLAK